jgi:hypothetical protein
LRSLYWLPNLYQEVVQKKVELREYFSPTVCVTHETIAPSAPDGTEN